jgi:hypothetical protein
MNILAEEIIGVKGTGVWKIQLAFGLIPSVNWVFHLWLLLLGVLDYVYLCSNVGLL